jgi:hypothetical protein
LFVCGAATDAACPEALAESAAAAGDWPETEVVKNVIDVNARATEVLMHARGIDTSDVPPEAIQK